MSELAGLAHNLPNLHLLIQPLIRREAVLSSRHPKGIQPGELFGIVLRYFLDNYSPEGRAKKRKKRQKEREKSAEPVGAENKTPDGQNDAPGSGKSTRSRHIPQEIRDEVYIRDGNRCTYISKDGKRCEETSNLQIDHIIPYAKGGSNEPENLRLLCFAHNQLMAEEEFGEEHMRKFKRRE